jgi:type IV secretory pathway VirJ component
MRHPHPAVFCLRALTVALMLLQAACAPRLPAAQTLHSDDWGNYAVQPPGGVANRLAFVFGPPSDRRLTDATRALAGRGALVVRVDPALFAAGVRDRDERCLDLAGIVNWHANYLGRRFSLANLDPPLLVGAADGAGLVYALLAQAPPLTFAAAVSDLPAPRLAIPKAVCGVSRRPASHGALTLRAVSLTTPWTVTGTAADESLLTAIQAKNPPARVSRMTVPLVTAVMQTFDALEVPQHQAASIADLPVVELPAARRTDALAVVYSGDGGWRDIDKTIGGLLAQSGIAVVGVDSVRYFWHRRSPEQTAADLARILEHYRIAWGSRRVLLIGYSFGADILPFAYNRLPAEHRARVATVALLAAGRGADFEVSVSGWLGQHTAQEQPTLPELVRLPAARVLCVYGTREAADSLCTAPGVGAITRLARPGDHHFDRRYGVIANAIRAHFGAAGAP